MSSRAVATDWWKQFFDRAYVDLWEAMLGPDAARDDALTIQTILARYGLEPGSRILDAPCGSGRIAVHLAIDGWHVHAIDGAPGMVDIARHRSSDPLLAGRLSVEEGLVEALDAYGFDAALNWFGSLGYSLDPDDDVAHLAAIGRAVTPGGIVLIDTDHHGFLRDHFVHGRVEYENETGSVVSTRQYDRTRRIFSDEQSLMHGGSMRLARFSVRIYSLGELQRLCLAAGIEVIELLASDGIRPASDSGRVIVVGRVGQVDAPTQRFADCT